MSNLSDLLPAGASGKKAEFTASGAISSGDTVVVNTDGTVSVVASVTPSFPTTNKVFESGQVKYVAATYDPINKLVVVAYTDISNSNYGTVVAGAISGNVISFGTPVVFYSASTDYVDIAADTINGDCAIVYFAQSWGRTALASLNGTSISIGTGDFYQAGVAYSKVTFCEGAQRWVVAWQAGANSNYLWAGMLYRSGSSLSETGKVQVVAQVPVALDIVYDSNQDLVVIAYTNSSDSNYGYAVVGNFISNSTQVSFTDSANTRFSLSTGSVSVRGLAFDSDTNQVVALVMYSNAVLLYVMQASSAGIVYGSPSAYLNNGAGSELPAITYDATTQQAIVALTSGNLMAVVSVDIGNLTATQRAVTTSTQWTSTQLECLSVVSEPGTGVSPVLMGTRVNTNRGECFIYNGIDTNALPAKKFVGIAEEDISNSATGEIVLTGGISENVSIPVIKNNSTVYLQRDGSLSLTVSPITAGMAFNAATRATPDTSLWSYESKSLSVGSQDTIPNGVAFNNDGTKLYIAGNANDTIYQYALTTAYDVSTGSYESKSFSVATQLTGPCGLAFNTSGTKMYVQDFNTDTVFQYSLSTAFDVSTASYDSVSLDASGQDTSTQAMVFKPDGTSLFIAGNTNDTVYQYDLTTAFDLSTASYASKSFNASAQVTTAAGIGFTDSGKKMYVLDNSDQDIHQYTLTTAYDVSTASYASASFDTTSQDSSAFGIVFKPDGTKLYVVGRTNDAVYQYATTGFVANRILLNG
jgi:sugar lactone lactonase YvrE